MSAADAPGAVEGPKARMWRALGALEAVFCDLPDLPDLPNRGGYVGLYIGPAGDVQIQLSGEHLDAAAELADRLDLTHHTTELYEGTVHHDYTGIVAGQLVRVIAIEKPQDRP